jgi:hypothetical protein
MRTILLTLLFFSICSACYSQAAKSKPTRKETEAWIILKIQKYINKEAYFSSEDIDKTLSNAGVEPLAFNYKWLKKESNFKFNFIDNNLIVNSDIEETTSNKYISDLPFYKKINYKKEVFIPLDKISQKIFIKDGYLFFESTYNSIIEKSVEKGEFTSRYYGIKINQFEEENFTERFNKAMNHLLSFIKKSSNSDIF